MDEPTPAQGRPDERALNPSEVWEQLSPGMWTCVSRCGFEGLCLGQRVSQRRCLRCGS
jgi:hypothetical protein